MTHTYQIEGLHCGSCVAKVKNELLKIGDVTEAGVQLKSPQATISMSKHIELATLQRAIKKAGEYFISETGTNGQSPVLEPVETKTWFEIYKPLLLVFAFIMGIATITSWKNGAFHLMDWMANFMGGLFVAFSFFKLLDLRGFAESYSSYDLLAKRFFSYGFIYPFIELGLGLAYITGWEPYYTNLITAIVMGFSSIGVIQAVANKRKINCACLGAVFNLPMSTVTIIEDLLMVGMALVSLFFI
ncbi:MAG TPA: MauE/DoxX family redox-associated membrane protein [Chitinophagaceae bacterium]